jgi:hypothetical protein
MMRLQFFYPGLGAAVPLTGKEGRRKKDGFTMRVGFVPQQLREFIGGSDAVQ